MELTIGQVSEKTGLSVHALRYYEREGLLPGSVSRSSGGRRRYSAFDVNWIQMCTHFRACGMPVSEIRRYARMVDAGPGNEAGRLELLRAQEARLRAEMERMSTCLTMVTAKADLYAEHVSAGTAGTLWTGEPPACLALEAAAQPV